MNYTDQLQDQGANK